MKCVHVAAWAPCFRSHDSPSNPKVLPMPLPATVAAPALRNDPLRYESVAIGSVSRWMQHIPQSYKVE